MGCDMCGSEGPLFICEIEGTKLKVCKKCSKYGKIVQSVKPQKSKKEIKKEQKVEKKKEIVETILIINPSFAKIIKKAREKMGLKQEEAAKKLNEKTSLIHHLETGKVKPSIELAKKLEKFFRINLIQEIKEEKDWKGKANSGQMTVGDLLKL